jgi:hypothetical protein
LKVFKVIATSLLGFELAHDVLHGIDLGNDLLQSGQYQVRHVINLCHVLSQAYLAGSNPRGVGMHLDILRNQEPSIALSTRRVDLAGRLVDHRLLILRPLGGGLGGLRKSLITASFDAQQYLLSGTTRNLLGNLLESRWISGAGRQRRLEEDKGDKGVDNVPGPSGCPPWQVQRQWLLQAALVLLETKGAA